MVGSGESPAFTAAVGRALSIVRSAIPVLEVSGGLPPGSLRLPEWAPCAASLPSIKKFFVGLLEEPCNHEWWASVARLSLEHRTTIAGTLFLARKLLPASPSPWEEHYGRVCDRPTEVSPAYLRHVRWVVRRNLGYAWDRGRYDRHVSSFVPPLSSCLEASRSKGGARSKWTGRRDEFFRGAFGISPLDIQGDSFPVRFMNVETSGKSRSVTVAPSGQCLLGPLHRCLYDAVSGRNWLLRGAAKPAKFKDFGRKRGEVFVSGDYESATDNLPLSVAEAILREAKELSVEVPAGVWEIAFRSLRAQVFYPDGSSAAVVRGQLMGNLLSFPLLCLQNYAAFTYLVPDPSVPVLINGDDIVFRATPEVAQRWMDGVSRLGLKLCAGKTLVSKSVYSLNSAFFRARAVGSSRIPVLRFSSLRDVDVSPHALAPGLSSFREGFTGFAKIKAELVYLHWRKRQFEACGRSILRDLSAPTAKLSLAAAGLLAREAFFLECPPCPLPPSLQRAGVPQLDRKSVV